MITISQLIATKENSQILKGIDLNFASNKTYVLLGPNGSGKSTLAKALAGDPSVRAVAKNAKFLDKDLLELSATARNLEGLFLAHQSPPEIAGLNIFSFLHLIFAKHSKTAVSVREFDKILNENLAKVGLPQEIKSRNFNENFSGGERKKMEVLQILLLKPKFVILDEIDSGVDIDSLKIILKVVENFKSETQATLLFITHNLSLAKKILADEIFVMKSGQIVRQAELLKEKNELFEILEKEGYESF